MIDTGASYSLLDMDVFKKLENSPPVQPTKIKAYAANNLPIELEGTTVVTIDGLGFSEGIMVHLQRNCFSSMILGSNFLARFKTFTINNEEQYIDLAGSRVHCNNIPYVLPQNKGDVYLMEHLKFPQRAITTFAVNVPSKNFKEIRDVVFTPLPFFDTRIHFATCVNHVTNTQIRISALNTTTE